MGMVSRERGEKRGWDNKEREGRREGGSPSQRFPLENVTGHALKDAYSIAYASLV